MNLLGQAAEQTAKAKILVVDDQPINIQILYQILCVEHDIFVATSGAETLAICAEIQPDLILLDVMMPDMDGHEVCRRLKADPQLAEIPVIFVTAQNLPEEEAMCLDIGAVDFIARPVNAPVVQARVRTHLALKRQGDLLRSMALLDGLTGIANRRNFDETLVREWRDCQRHGFSLSVILIDVDHFKLFNDRYGHQQGDVCLRAVAKAINGCLGRAHDLAARYGGEEFACILPNCNLERGLLMAERLRATVQSLDLPHEASPTARMVTASVGVSCVVPQSGFNAGQLLVMADQMLYAAKKGGRNQVMGSDLIVTVEVEHD